MTPRARAATSLALPLSGLVLGVAYLLGALALPRGSVTAPGAGLFPLAVGLIIVVSSAVALVTEWRRPTAAPDPPGDAFRRVPALLGALVVFALLLKPAGFILAAAVLSALVLAVLGRRPWLAVGGLALAISVATALVFRLLGVPLPPGLVSLG